jgi:HSP20 family protein
MALSEFPRLGFDPFVELRRMQSEMNRLFSGFTPAAREFPPINIWLGDNSVVVTGELPGVTRDDVAISLQEDVLNPGCRARWGGHHPRAAGADDPRTKRDQ